jgi:hypothetical protein
MSKKRMFASAISASLAVAGLAIAGSSGSAGTEPRMSPNRLGRFIRADDRMDEMK